MLREQKEVVFAKETRYRLGLQKLTETEVMVDGLKKQLTEMQPILEQAQLDTNVLLETVANDQKEADAQQTIVSKDVEAAKIVAQEVSTIAQDCEKDLAVAMPAYEASIKALNALDKKHIQELKSFSSPPPAVSLTLNGVCLLFGAKQEWSDAKKLMGDLQFLEKLKKYDKDNISPKIIKSLKKLMNDPDFTPEHVKNVSVAASSLFVGAGDVHI